MPRLNLIITCLIILLMALLQSCGGGGGMTMNSKESRGSSVAMAPMESAEMFYGGEGGAAAPEMDGYDGDFQTGSNYDSQYRDPTRSAGRTAGITDDVDIPSGGMLQSIDDWLNPKAWAQEPAGDQSFIIRNGNLEIEIDDYDKSSAEVKTIAIRHGGIITDSQMQKYGDNMRVGWITLRVPGDKFDQCFEDLQGVGEVKVQNVSSEDVTNEYISGVSRMQALQTEHTTLQGMLEDAREIQRSRGLGEAYSVLLDTQRRLSEVTTELQTVENRVNSLKDRIQRSTITVNLSERPLAPPPDEFAWGFGASFENAKKDLLHGIDYTVSGIIYFLVNGLIWWLIWIVIIFLAWKLFLGRLWQAIRRAALAKGEEPLAR
ncbi:DUF4349 domain-containing protein [bacterium]|nr:DUF4349 domain-containing protein [bacterium]